MAEPIRFTVHGRPQQRGSKRAVTVPDGKGGIRKRKNGQPLIVARDDNEKSGDWMNQIRDEAARTFNGRELLAGPLRLTCWFYFKRPGGHFGSGRNAGRLKPSAPGYHAQSPDLSKLLRCLEDALTGVVWVDDRQVCGYGNETGKFWTTTGECAEILIEELG
jgi:Holliday junction resolvase RusA-like endonuclease